MPGCVVYMRVSTDEQLPESQETVINDFIRSNGYTVLKRFKERISGSVPPMERPVFREMMDYVRRVGVPVIVMYDMTRFYRSESPIDALREMRKIMDEYGVVFVFVREPVIQDPLLRELWMFIKAWYASYERHQISLRTRYGLMRVKQEGRLYHRPTLAHYFASVLYNKPLKELRPEEVNAARIQLKAIVGKYWNAKAYKKYLIHEVLVANEPIIRKMYEEYPNAPRSYQAFRKLMSGE